MTVRVLGRNASRREGLTSFVVFSDDWGEHMSSSQHLFRHIAAQHRVLWVNTVGMRRPTLTLADLRKACRKLSRMMPLRRPNKSEGNSASPITVCQPFMLPFGRYETVRAFNTLSVTRTVRATVERAQLRCPIVVCTVPNAGDYRDLLRDWTVVYYCVDDFALWPRLDADLVREMESRLIARADVLVAASGKLCDRLAASGKPTHLLTHGVDVELFAAQAPAEHICLRDIPRPRAGFFGLIDDRTDQDLMISVARLVPYFSLVFAGPIESAVAPLAACPNVHFTGPVRYRELPSLIRGFDVLFIPYRTGELAESLSPLKLKEYLVTGKPIVSTPIAEARERKAHVSVAATAEEWATALSAALTTDGGARKHTILPAMEAESWAFKAQSLLKICTDAALERSARASPAPTV